MHYYWIVGQQDFTRVSIKYLCLSYFDITNNMLEYVVVDEHGAIVANDEAENNLIFTLFKFTSFLYTLQEDIE